MTIEFLLAWAAIVMALWILVGVFAMFIGTIAEFIDEDE